MINNFLNNFNTAGLKADRRIGEAGGGGVLLNTFNCKMNVGALKKIGTIY